MANQITIFRAFLVPVFITVSVYHNPSDPVLKWLPLGIFLTACLSDALDGFVARLLNQKTLLGQIIDPIADKLLLISGFLSIYFSPRFLMKPPAWLVILVCSRDVFIISGIILIYLTSGTIHADPSDLGKITTFFQMITVVALLVPLKIANAFLWPTATLTFISGLAYLWREVERGKMYAVK